MKNDIEKKIKRFWISGVVAASIIIATMTAVVFVVPDLLPKADKDAWMSVILITFVCIIFLLALIGRRKMQSLYIEAYEYRKKNKNQIVTK